MESKSIQEKLNEYGFSDILAPDRFDGAFIGLSHNGKAVYDEELVDFDKETDDFFKSDSCILMKRCGYKDLDPGVLVIGNADEADALNTAIIGITSDGRAVYDYDNLIYAFADFNNWSYDEAIEWYEFNTLRSLPYFPNHPYVVTNIEYML